MTNGCDMIEGPMGKKDLPPEKAAALFGVGKLKRHMFICIGPDCVDEEEGAETWKYLKKRMKELDITGADGPSTGPSADACASARAGPSAWSIRKARGIAT